MPVLAIFTSSEIIQQRYEALRPEVKWETTHPSGGLFHACAFDDKGNFHVADLCKGEITMYHQTLIGRSLQTALRCSLLFLLGLVGSFVHAQAPDQEQALTRTARDAQLKWGPCPPFLPKGCSIAVLHGDPAKDNVDVFFKVPAKSAIALHWHTSAERMVLVAGEFHVTYDGQKTAILRSGTYAYGPAKLPHKGFCASAVPCVLFIAFESPLDAVPIESTGK